MLETQTIVPSMVEYLSFDKEPNGEVSEYTPAYSVDLKLYGRSAVHINLTAAEAYVLKSEIVPEKVKNAPNLNGLLNIVMRSHFTFYTTLLNRASCISFETNQGGEFYVMRQVVKNEEKTIVESAFLSPAEFYIIYKNTVVKRRDKGVEDAANVRCSQVAGSILNMKLNHRF